MSVVQWVNLTKDEIYTQDSDIDSVDRCGELSIKMSFEKSDVPTTYQVELKPFGSDNVTYSAAEESRNTNFKMPLTVSGTATEQEVTLCSAIKLPAAGGNKYKLEAKDGNGNVVESLDIETKRKMYYQFMSMDDTNGSVTSYALTKLETHCEKNSIKLNKKGSDKKIPFHKNVCTNDSANGMYTHRLFGADIKSACDLDPKHLRYGCAAVLSNYIAKILRNQTTLHATTIGTTNPEFTITNASISVSVDSDHLLWHGFDDLQDATKYWFVCGEIYYDDLNDPSAFLSATISRSDIDITGSKQGTYGGYNQLEIAITPDIQAIISKTRGLITVSLDLNLTKGFSGGFSWNPGGMPFITCATKSLWKDIPQSRSTYIWNHEIGHRFGMVAHGDKDHSATNSKFRKKPKLPDAPPTLYGENRGVNDKSHSGPHCEEGVTYTQATKRWSGTPGCVMFGATGTSSARSPEDYCSNCEVIVKKLDLS